MYMYMCTYIYIYMNIESFGNGRALSEQLLSTALAVIFDSTTRGRYGALPNGVNACTNDPNA